MANGEHTRDDAALPPELSGAIPWVAASSLVAAAQWATLPLAAWSFDRHNAWWMPLAVGALLRQAAAPALRARMARAVRPRVTALIAARALDSGAFEAEPTALAPIAQRVEHALEDSLPTLFGGALGASLFAALAARVFPWPWSVAMALACAGAVGVRALSRRHIEAGSDALLDALRSEGQRLHAAARGRWEITGEARQRFLSDTSDASRSVVEAEQRQHARVRAVRSAQLALFMAPLAWLLLHRAREGAPVSLRDWVLVLPALAPALAALRGLDEVAFARRALDRMAVSPSRISTEAPAALDPAEAPLTLDRVTVRYGAHLALDAVSLTVPPRGVLAIVGPNGAGKSTLARVLAGAVAPDDGRCAVGDLSMTAVSPEEVAFVPQHPCVVEGATVIDNARLVAPTALDADVTAALASLGLSVALDHRAAGLSRGEQRRIAIARALLRKPRWLILDEPDAWLDHGGREALQRALREAAKTSAVVLVTHRADLVDWADRVVVLSADHTVEAEGSPAETLARSPTGRALMASLADESLRFSAR